MRLCNKNHRLADVSDGLYYTSMLAISPTKFNLRRVNDGLSAAIILIAMYIFLLPVVPQFGWWLHHSVPVISRTTRHNAQSSAAHGAAIPKDNRLVIPALGLNQPIYEGQSVYTVNKGVWIRPNASTPDKGSNTVMVGHRFTYTNPRGVFYFLDKLKPGDVLTVDWHGRAYSYRTQTISVVPPTDSSVEAPTTQNELTLYTCTPLWSLKSRLVIVALREPTT